MIRDPSDTQPATALTITYRHGELLRGEQAEPSDPYGPGFGEPRTSATTIAITGPMMNMTRRNTPQIASVSNPDPTPGFSPGADDGRDSRH
jgi:hypothetical protein